MNASDPPPPEPPAEPDDAAALDALLRSVPMDAADLSPDPGLLVAFHQGRLAPEQAAEVEAGLAGSPFARDLLASLSSPVPDALADWATAAIPNRRRRRWPIAAGLALAAAVSLFVLWPGRVVEAPDAYAVTAIQGDRSATRSADAQVPVFVAGGALRIFVAPTSGSARPALHAALFVLRGGELSPVTATVEPIDGAFRIDAAADAAFPAPGRWSLQVGLAIDPEALTDAVGRAPGDAAGVRLVPVDARYTTDRPERGE